MARVDYQPIIVQDVLNWHKGLELFLNPWYQRRSVWAGPQKAYLINTLFEQKPVPTLYFRHSVDLEEDKSVREVVDGQQRIRAIIEYAAGDFPALHPSHGKKVKYESLTNKQKLEFRETKLSGGWLLSASDGDVIEIFARLNSVAKTLNKQEKRNAEFGGDFKQFCLKQASSRMSLWRQLQVFSANDISRMLEIEFLSDVVHNLVNGLSDFTPASIDSTYRKFDENFPNAKAIEKRLDSIFNRVANLPSGKLKDTIFRRKPIFFSLVLELDANKRARGASLLDALVEMDGKYNSDKPLTERAKRDVEFYEACRSSTQRIASRKVRAKYIKSHLR